MKTILTRNLENSFPTFTVASEGSLHQGDLSADLDYVDEFSLILPDNSTMTGENGIAVNIALPPIGHAAVYRVGTGISLSTNSDIVIDTSPPVVVMVG